jgi:hypothetical protein
MRSAYSNRGYKNNSSRNNRSNSAQGDVVKGLKKTPTPDGVGKKKEIMKLTIMNPSFKNETIVYNNAKRIDTPEKKHEVMSAKLNEDGKVFSSKNSAYSSVISKRRSKNDRKLGFGSFGGPQA